MNIKMRITEEESTFNNPESTPEEKLAARDRIDDLRMAIDTINTQRIMEEYEFGLNEELESDYGSGEVIGSYSLDNLALEYETIENSDLADDITSLYTSGRSLSYQHVTLMRINYSLG